MWLLFFPLSLNEQMKYFTNRYFTLIAVLQLDSYITPTHPATTWIPLLVIFLFTAVRELVDDRQRLFGDTQANQRTYHVASAASKPASGVPRGEGGDDAGAVLAVTSGFHLVAAQDIQVGDVVMVGCDDEVPCDMVLLSSSQSEGNCFIETSNLDGEADLKLRRSIPHTSLVPLTSIAVTAGGISTLEVPLLAPHQLQGTFSIPEPDSQAGREAGEEGRGGCQVTGHVTGGITETQALLQGSFIKNTQWAVGVCVYTGNETRLGRSRRAPAGEGLS